MTDSRSREEDVDVNLSAWLKQATAGLCREAVARVHEEIEAHHASARDEALAAGESAVAARRSALRSLGDARAVNREYRKVLLTAAEADHLERLRDSWPPPIAGALGTIGLVMLLLLRSTTRGDTREIIGWTGILILLSAHFLIPARTRPRGLLYRYARWVTIAALPLMMSQWQVRVVIAVGVATVFAALVGPAEWRRMTLRRKLPIERWPLGLFP